jgi:hypothetical protein
MLAALDR